MPTLSFGAANFNRFEERLYSFDEGAACRR
jgi:hypothetical protein